MRKRKLTEFEEVFNCSFSDLIPKHMAALKVAFADSIIKGNDLAFHSAVYKCLEEGRLYGELRTKHLIKTEGER